MPLRTFTPAIKAVAEAADHPVVGRAREAAVVGDVVVEILEDRMVDVALVGEEPKSTVVAPKRSVVLLARRTESMLRCWSCRTNSGSAACGVFSAVVLVTSPGRRWRQEFAFT